MNTQTKSRLIIAAAVVLGVTIGLFVPMLVKNTKKQTAQQNSSVSDTTEISSDTADTTQSAAAISPQSKPPVLKIGGKENSDVYLQSLDIQIEVTGSIASTRYTMIFKNKTDRILEGELTFPLPDGRSVTYYALDINGKMREAVPVEKAKGTEVFEEIEQRRVDPGLLERVEGNNFRTRIYPIPARGTRTVAIGYEEELALEKDSLQYRLPLAYTDSLEKFAVKATVWKSNLKPIVPETESAEELRFDKVGENYAAALTREKYRPVRALNFALPAPVDIPQVMMQSAQGSHYFLASVAPKMETRKKLWDNELAIIWDVSLSGLQRDLKREMDLLNTIFTDKKNADVHLYFLNNRFKKIANKGTVNGEYKVTNGKWDELKSVLEKAAFDGGTDFSQINADDITGNEILLFSDGISTLSDADFLKNTKASHPIHCVVSSAKADYSVMKLITGKTKGKFVNITALSPKNLKGELLNETLQFLGTEHGKSVREVYPSVATPVRGNFSVAGISDVNDAEITLLFGFGNKVEKRITVKLDAKSAGKQGNAYKIWAQKKIAELDLNYEKNRAELTGLGQQFGIVTRNTSLIVLETIDDYIRYNIEPPAELRAEYLRRMKDRGWGGQLGGGAKNKNEIDGLLEELMGGAAVSGGYSARSVNNNSDGSVLGIVHRQRLGSPVASADIFGKGGTDIDAILSNVGGLKSGGDGGAGRKGTAGIGYGSGYGSGFGGGGGGVDDLLGGLMGGGSGGLELKKRGELRVSSPDFLRGGNLTGGRSRASIQRVVMQNMAALRYAYNKRLREKPGLCGKITIKFAIDEFGKVAFAMVVESTMNDSLLEQTVLAKVKSWNFEKIDKPGDLTDVTYPFVFDNDGPCSNTTARSAQTNERADSAKQEQRTAAQASGKTDSFEDTMDSIDQQAKERAEREKVQREAEERLEQARQQARERAAKAEREAQARERARAEQQARERAEQIERERRAYYGDTLNGAVAAVQNLKQWWSIDFTPPKSNQTPKYPMPDEVFSETGYPKDGFVKNTDYLKKMTGKTTVDYQTYLDIRKDYASSPTFYFNMASWFYACGDKETALRVLTSIADLELENASLYRLLGYRLKEFGEYALEKFVCKKVVLWRPMEPQSYRDYALALADNGEDQAALNWLYGLLTKTYSANIRSRSGGIEEVVVMEINRLIAKNANLNTSKVYKRLIANMPVDVRVVINWNMNSTDIDLYVKDPNNEDCYYRNRKTSIGGRISADNTNGYGPEQFLLKKAVKGKYRIYVNYYGDRQVTNAGPSTIMAEIYTTYADKTERRQVVCLQMSNAKTIDSKYVDVANFEF